MLGLFQAIWAFPLLSSANLLNIVSVPLAVIKYIVWHVCLYTNYEMSSSTSSASNVIYFKQDGV